MSRSFTPVDFAQIILIAFIWGLNNIAAKIAVMAFPPLFSLVLRFAVVALALSPWLRLPPPGAWKPVGLMLLCIGPCHFGVQYVGLAMAHQLAPLVVGMQLWAPFSVLYARLFLRERISPLRLAGMVCAFAGVAGMSFDPAVFAELIPLALIVFAASSYALGAVVVRRMPSVSAMAMQAWLAIALTPTLGFGSALFEHGQINAALHAGWLAWACVLFGAFASSLIANFLMFRLVQRYEVGRITPYLLLSPVIAFLLSGPVFDDRITPQIALGGAATLGGVVLVAVAERRFARIRSKL